MLSADKNSVSITFCVKGQIRIIMLAWVSAKKFWQAT
jgi:hypothetical protein